jgi:hypothetical protein
MPTRSDTRKRLGASYTPYCNFPGRSKRLTGHAPIRAFPTYFFAFVFGKKLSVSY